MHYGNERKNGAEIIAFVGKNTAHWCKFNISFIEILGWLLNISFLQLGDLPKHLCGRRFAPTCKNWQRPWNYEHFYWIASQCTTEDAMMGCIFVSLARNCRKWWTRQFCLSRRFDSIVLGLLAIFARITSSDCFAMLETEKSPLIYLKLWKNAIKILDQISIRKSSHWWDIFLIVFDIIFYPSLTFI